MKALSLFSGIGGIDLAAEWAGMETVAFCEREAFPQRVLRKHWPDVPIYDDVCTLTADRLKEDGIIGDGRAIDLIHGGYPCQPFSHAGKRGGKKDVRHLWPEYFRLVQEVSPRWVVGENVVGHITLGLDDVWSDLESEGYSCGAIVLPAAGVGAPHKRDRVFIVAHANSGGCVEAWQQIMGRQMGAREYPSNMSPAIAYTSFNGPSRGWAPEPAVGRVANGVPDRVDRLRTLGNAVVPQQIYPIFIAIMEIEAMEIH